jgi:hypothetical protein
MQPKKINVTAAEHQKAKSTETTHGSLSAYQEDFFFLI